MSQNESRFDFHGAPAGPDYMALADKVKDAQREAAKMEEGLSPDAALSMFSMLHAVSKPQSETLRDLLHLILDAQEKVFHDRLTAAEQEIKELRERLEALKMVDIAPLLTSIADGIERDQYRDGLFIPTETHWMIRNAVAAIELLTGEAK